jgi:hypothetical protein
MTYFDRYSGEPFAHQQTYARMHLRFKDCPLDLAKAIMQVHVPTLIDQYKLDERLMQSPLNDIFALID